MNTMNINPNQFLRHWMLNAVGAFPVAAIASLIACIPIAIVTAMVSQYDIMTPIVNVIILVTIWVIPGTVTGYVIGEIQQTLLNEHLRWRIDGWIKRTVLGGFIGGVLVLLLTMLISRYLPERTQWMILLPIFILPVSITQWTTLRHTAREAWMWVLGNLVGAIVFSGLLFMNGSLFGGDYAFLVGFILWLLAAASFGVITGIVVLWLYERPHPEWDEDSELAPVYIEVRNQDKR